MSYLTLEDKTVLITGGAGFIGYHLSKYLIESDETIKIIGFDILNDYYDINLKYSRLKILKQYKNYRFIQGDLADQGKIEEVFTEYNPEIVVNLGGQAGVRYSIENPVAYMEANVTGFFNILEACRHSCKEGRKPVKHLVFASSSSVYGLNKKIPYAVADKTDSPVSLYAATKKSNELMAHAYSNLYGISCTGLRFFTVYGPMGRPDMAYFGFTDKLIRGEKIQIFNHGDMYRDFTYVDDIVSAVSKIMKKTPELTEDGLPYKIYNIGNNKPESLLHFVEVLENCLLKEGMIDKPGEKELLPMQPGDVYQTYADVEELIHDFGFKPDTKLEQGLSAFVKWYKEYYKINR